MKRTKAELEKEKADLVEEQARQKLEAEVEELRKKVHPSMFSQAVEFVRHFLQDPVEQHKEAEK